ncbi:DUF5324 family protein [Streptomyces hainanensis]|uniref:Uncharacterized protein n=1 Tax=Streptomyces hainanensis TaxID=402648 RepID=A0A4R4T8S5_9ACTN|nr:DUF5324 family protein [Streptomyces hainanensis]TDC73447.1 hypothetical protein E1283_19160 [Streptomyces hainanensis]
MSHNGKSGVRHATDLVTPYAAGARRNASQYAQQAGAYVGPRARRVADQARSGYATQLAPRMERAMASAGPAGRQAAARSQAALAVLRGEVTPGDVRSALRRRQRCHAAGRVVRRIGMLGLAAGGAFAAWKWWSGQNDPDWLAEPTPGTEVLPEAEAG